MTIITESDVIRAINETLAYRFKKIPTLNRDLSIAKRPCFVLDTVRTKHTKIARTLEETTINFNLFYFSKSIEKQNTHLQDMKTQIRDFLRCKIETQTQDERKDILCFSAENIEQDVDDTMYTVNSSFSISFETLTAQEITDNTVSRFEDARINTNTELMDELIVSEKN